MNYLELKDITMKFNSHHVLDNLNCSVQEGEILVILGPSGCGKTTFLNVVSGFLQPSHGDILLNSESIKGQKGMFAYMFQEDRLLPWRTLLENVLLPDEIDGDDIVRVDKAREYLVRMGLGKFEKYYPQNLSGGMRKRAALARTFNLGKELILFDEPLVSIDYDLGLELERQIFEHITKERRTAIIVTHSYDTAVALADRIILLTSTPTRIREEFKAGFARLHNSPTEARKTKEFFTLTKELLDIFQRKVK
jgi:ABC-type nitrate/sulfonate/bicarbonate transport system ATPase subunit